MSKGKTLPRFRASVCGGSIDR